jgi:hypothetical protein
MKLSIITIAISVLFCADLFSQVSLTCGTPALPDEEFEQLPWYGDFSRVERSIDSLQNLLFVQVAERDGAGCPYQTSGWQGLLAVPVHLWIYQEVENDPLLLPDNRYQQMLDYTNALFQNSGLQIHLYIACQEGNGSNLLI